MTTVNTDSIQTVCGGGLRKLYSNCGSGGCGESDEDKDGIGGIDD